MCIYIYNYIYIYPPIFQKTDLHHVTSSCCCCCCFKQILTQTSSWIWWFPKIEVPPNHLFERLLGVNRLHQHALVLVAVTSAKVKWQVRKQTKLIEVTPFRPFDVSPGLFLKYHSGWILAKYIHWSENQGEHEAIYLRIIQVSGLKSSIIQDTLW